MELALISSSEMRPERWGESLCRTYPSGQPGRGAPG
jgi:hypothetical protein